MASPNKPLPVFDNLTAPFWEAAARRRLSIQRCDSCHRYRHFPAPLCPACGSWETSWAQVSGRGRIHTFTVIYRTHVAGFADGAPYVAAWIELEEQAGLRILSGLDEDPAGVAIGSQVEVFFEERGEMTIPRFRLSEPESSPEVR